MVLYSQKKLTFSAVVGVVVISLVGWFVFGAGAAPKTSTSGYIKKVGVITPQKTVPVSNMVYSGTLNGYRETDLSMQISGRVSRIQVEVGDKVKKGETVAVAEGDRQQAQESIRRQYYLNTTQNLENTKQLMKQQIENAKTNLTQAQKNLQLIKTSRGNEDILQPEKVKEAQIQLQKAKTRRENLISSFNQKEKNILDNSLSVIQRSAVISNNALGFLYSLNGEDLSGSKNDFYISGKFISGKTQLTIDTENQISGVKGQVKQLRQLSKKLKDISVVPKNKDTIVSGTKKAQKTVNSVEEVLWNMKEILDNSIVHSDLSPKTLQEAKAKISEYIGQSQKMLLSYNGDRAGGLVGVDQAWESLKTERENQLATANNRIDLAQQKLELLKSGNSTKDKTLDQKVEVAKTRVKKAKQALETARSRYKSRIQEMRTRVEQARGKLKVARVGTNDTLLQAPYSGVITKKYLDEGRVVNAGTPVLRLTDTSKMKAVIYVPQNQVETIQVGDTATATHGNNPDRQWRAEVVNISPASRQSSQKNKIELILGNPNGLNPGMYMDVRFNRSGQELVWSVPGRAVADFYGSPIVYVVRDGRVHQKQVKITGEYKNSVYLDGDLSEQDRVVVSGMSGLNDGEPVQVVDQ